MKDSIKNQLEDIKNSGLLRSTRLISNCHSSRVVCDGREVLLLCSNNYLGLADHKALSDAAVAATRHYGTSSGASRLVSGTMTLHEQLESAITSFKKTESALIFNSGHAANVGIIPVLAGRGDVVFSDRLNHASIIDGIMLSGARLVRYPHNDYKQLETLMAKYAKGRSLIVSDAVFSMDGDIANLAELVALKKRHNALLMIDDAHGSGVLGEKGRGTATLQGVVDEIDIQMGTFGKALGSFGAYAGVSAEMRQLLINRARSFIFSTSLPPAVLAASIAAVEIVQSKEGDLLRERLAANTVFFRAALAAKGFNIPEGSTQIVPLLTGSAVTTMKFSDALFEQGVFAQGIRPPTVPNGTSRLRFTVMSTHTMDDLAFAVEQITQVGQQLGVI
ncbi:MAG: 8-amino-7-oxononanoate synthase [Desulfuromonadaceae bacterium]|nr:8-amino-7-oxononanoate synthase [Desulfuromonadaceae bacterium]MDD2854083.1 8-amino-7-oxononanoate synthase [Desulfuromonadaceae bacterium]